VTDIADDQSRSGSGRTVENRGTLLPRTEKTTIGVALVEKKRESAWPSSGSCGGEHRGTIAVARGGPE
jgi:hypothetical protein